VTDGQPGEHRLIMELLFLASFILAIEHSIKCILYMKRQYNLYLCDIYPQLPRQTGDLHAMFFTTLLSSNLSRIPIRISLFILPQDDNLSVSEIFHSVPSSTILCRLIVF
jgi:hypothetical protein